MEEGMNDGSLGALPKEKPPPLLRTSVPSAYVPGAGASLPGPASCHAAPTLSPKLNPFSMRLRSAATARISSMWYIPGPGAPEKSLAATLPMSSLPPPKVNAGARNLPAILSNTRVSSPPAYSPGPGASGSGRGNAPAFHPAPDRFVRSGGAPKVTAGTWPRT